MKLYHGSNMSIEEIDLKRGRKGKDFGQGFYLSADRSQALMMAERTVDREESGKATLTTYLFDDSILFTLTTDIYLPVDFHHPITAHDILQVFQSVTDGITDQISTLRKKKDF